MPAYKHIVLELIQQDYPVLHERLRSTKTLLQAANDYATALRSSHLTWMDELKQANPGFEESQLSSEALEMAIQDLIDALPSELPTSDGEDGLSLDNAMSFIRRHTQPA
jgi:hypothetical protein